MQIGLISDLHGNLTALDAVLDELEGQQVDEIVCLGDTAALGPQPREVLARLRDLRCRLVMGNTDAWLSDPEPYTVRDADSQRVTEIELWCAHQLLPEDHESVRSFRKMVSVSLDGRSEMLCFHGSPRSDRDIVVSDTPAEELAEMLGGLSAPIMAGGHSHKQMLRPYGEALLVNPGSVGLPCRRIVSTGRVYRPPWAEFAVVDWQEYRWSVELGRVCFEIERLFEIAMESGMPHVEWWMEAWNRDRTL